MKKITLLFAALLCFAAISRAQDYVDVTLIEYPTNSEDQKLTGISNTESHTSTITEQYQQTNDSLGSILVEYYNPIVLNTNSLGTQAELRVYTTGDIDIIMLPMEI